MMVTDISAMREEIDGVQSRSYKPKGSGERDFKCMVRRRAEER